MVQTALGFEGAFNSASAGILLYNALVDLIVPAFATTDRVFPQGGAIKILPFACLYTGFAVHVPLPSFSTCLSLHPLQAWGVWGPESLGSGQPHVATSWVLEDARAAQVQPPSLAPFPACARQAWRKRILCTAVLSRLQFCQSCSAGALQPRDASLAMWGRLRCGPAGPFRCVCAPAAMLRAP